MRLVAVGPVLGFACALLSACSTHDGAAGVEAGRGDADTPSSDDAGLESGASPDTDGGAGESGGDDSAPVLQTFIRVAQLSPDLPPVDVCVALHGTTTFQGPLLAALASSTLGTDAAAPGLAYAQVSAYIAVAPGQYDVRIVAAGATDCSTGLGGVSTSALDGGALDGSAADDADADAGAGAGTDAGADADAGLAPLPPSASNAHATILIAGLLSPTGTDESLTVTAIADDSTLAGQAIALRAVNAMPTAPVLDFGLGSFSTSWLPLLTNVAFASASAHVGPSVGAVDTNGYLPLAPLSSQTVSARVSSGATSDAAIAKSITIGSGSVATVVALGGRAGDTAHPAALLLCVDNAPSGGLLSDCSIQSDAGADE